MSDVQLEMPVQDTPPPTFDLKPSAQEATAEQKTPATFAEEKKTDQKPETEKSATAEKSDPASPADSKTASEIKSDEEKKSEGEASSKEGEKKEKPDVPEKYDLKLSDNSLLKPAALDRIAAHAKAQGLSQEAAQELVKTQETEVQTAYSAAIEDRKNQWMEQCKSDKEIGGEQLDKSVSLAKGVLDKYGDDNFRKELTDGGFGNHPGLVRLLARIGKASANDKAVIPSATPKAQRSREDIFYDKTPKS